VVVRRASFLYLAAVGVIRKLSLLSLLVAVALPVHAELPDLINRIRPGVVAVGTVKPVKRTDANSGPALKYLGTGFVVGDGLKVITNFHVMPEKLDADAMESLAIFIGHGGVGAAREARVLRSDREHDVVLLGIRGDPLPTLTLAEDDHVREGQEIAFTGFPIGMVLGLYPATHRGIISTITPVVIPAESARSLTAAQIRRLRSPFDVYQLDAVAYPGNSGSPVYDVRSGKVIGVINSVMVKGTKESALRDPSGISYAIPVRYARALLAAGAGPERK